MTEVRLLYTTTKVSSTTDNGDQYTVYDNDNPNDGLDDDNNTINKSDDKRLDNTYNYGDNDNSYYECYDDGYNNNSCNGNGNDNNFDNKIAENFEDEILLFWDTFSADIWDLTTRINSLSTTIICDSHRFDHLLRVPTPLQPFTITIVGSTSSGGVHYDRCHLHTVLGLPLPPPKMNPFNQHHLCLHTGIKHGPRASNNHLKPIYLCGSRHQPRAPNPSTDFQLVEYLDSSDSDSALVCNVMYLFVLN